jgi:TPR repeat protein
MRLYGLGVARDDIRAAEAFQRAAEKGNADAEAALGMMLYHGQGGWVTTGGSSLD